MLQIITYPVVKKGMEHKGISLGRTIMLRLERLWSVKRHVSDEATLNSEEIKPYHLDGKVYGLSKDIFELGYA